MPVRWVIDSRSIGCDTSLQVPSLGIEGLKPGRNEFTFTPAKLGRTNFACAMGMYRGSITVIAAPVRRRATLPRRCPAMSAITRDHRTLSLTGMTCATCAGRIEKKLNRLDGVMATVNFALETAAVSAPAGAPIDEFVAAVDEGRLRRLGRARSRRSAAARHSRVAGGGARAATAAPPLDISLALAAARRRSRDDPAIAVPLLAVALAVPGRTGRDVGRPAVPQGSRDQRSSRRRDDGHPRQRRRQRRLPLVAVRAVLRRGGRGGHAT